MSIFIFHGRFVNRDEKVTLCMLLTPYADIGNQFVRFEVNSNLLNQSKAKMITNKTYQYLP